MARSIVIRPSSRFKGRPNHVLPNLVVLVAAILLSSCVYGPVALNVRVCNVSPTNIRVETVADESKTKVQEVIPGGLALAYASEVTVHGRNATTRISTASLSQPGGGRYKYAHTVRRGIGHNDVIFEVTIDEEGQAWALTPKGDRIPFPAQIVRHGDPTPPERGPE